jgi:hypothetical protein
MVPFDWKMPALDDPEPLVVQIMHARPSRAERDKAGSTDKEKAQPSRIVAAEQVAVETTQRMDQSSQKEKAGSTWRLLANELCELDLGAGADTDKEPAVGGAPEEDLMYPSGGNPKAANATEGSLVGILDTSAGTRLCDSWISLISDGSSPSEGTHTVFKDVARYVQVELSEFVEPVDSDSERTLSDSRVEESPGTPRTPRDRGTGAVLLECVN